MKQILLIEDDPTIVELLQIHLPDAGYDLESSLLGQEGLAKATHQHYNLIILDLMLPDLNGLEVCRQLRSQHVSTPILMLTAKSEEIDKVVGLELGADDYLTKPFSIRELLARVKAILRRSEMLCQSLAEPVSPPLQYRDLIIDMTKRRVMVKNQILELTPKEFDLLWLLARHPGRSYSRKELLCQVWGYAFEGYEHTVTAHINRLRAKIEPNLAHPVYILTAWGVGYRFAD